MKPAPLDLRVLDDVLKAAVREDVGSGDVTTAATVPASFQATGRYTAKQDVVVAGLAVVARLLEIVDPVLRYRPLVEDGDFVSVGTAIGEVQGSAASILTGERVTLNMLQRMCGIATYTREYVQRLAGTRTRVVDTRKTVPGLRLLDKYAVACGGGSNHRMGLFDAILIKNNHLAFHDSIAAAIAAARRHAGPSPKIEVEVTSPQDVDAAIQAGADAILLDNFTVEQTREAVRRSGGRVPLESSGGITLETIRDYAETGVDIISVGALTHSPPAADIHLRVTRT
ncbi:MAG TPA: carboxylating nicotinate-nucleotide diphosphorylase [Terriglobia bacterium]|nr:carboxylating nicotinate-nucleotide diphosphorylase [Terriglobia bacterium]